MKLLITVGKGAADMVDKCKKVTSIHKNVESIEQCKKKWVARGCCEEDGHIKFPSGGTVHFELLTGIKGSKITSVIMDDILAMEVSV